MSKEVVVTCDGCGIRINEKIYFTMSIRKVINGNQIRQPTLWLCPNCFKKTNFALLMESEDEK